MADGREERTKEHLTDRHRTTNLHLTAMATVACTAYRIVRRDIGGKQEVDNIEKPHGEHDLEARLLYKRRMIDGD